MRTTIALLFATSTLLACTFNVTTHPDEAAPPVKAEPRPDPVPPKAVDTRPANPTPEEPAPEEPTPEEPTPEKPTPEKPPVDEADPSPTFESSFAAPPSPGLDWGHLEGHWYATNKPSSDGTKVYVRNNPGPARFRQHYHFRSDGTLSYRVLHRTDRHYTTEGKWTRKGKRILVRPDGSGEESIWAFEVISLSKGLMRVKHLALPH